MTDIGEKSARLTDSQTRALLSEAVQSINRREMVAAEGALERVLSERPNSADALQLTGALRRIQNRPEEAEDFYRRAIAADPALPQVHHNLGNLLNSEGRIAEAVECQREAIRLKPNFLEAHIALGVALQDLGKPDEAEKVFRAGLRLQPNSLALKQSLGGALNDLKRGAEAETILRGALAQSTRDQRQTAGLLHNLGISLKQQHRHREALECLDRAQSLVPDMPAADYNRGNVLQSLGFLDAAVDSYRAALSRNPLDIKAHHDLNKLLYRLGRDEEFLRSYDDSAMLYPEVGALPMHKANFLFQLEKYDDAREHYERAARLSADSVTPHDALGQIFARGGDFHAAIREHETALNMEPDNAAAWVNFAETLIRAGDAKKAATAAERAMQIAPDNQHALAMWGLALRTQGDARDEWLNDYERFVQVFEIDPPQGYADMDAFNRDLNMWLNMLHVDKRENLDQTLRGGTQTLEDIFGAGHDLVERLRVRIDEAVAAYIARMQEDEKHPLLRRRNPAFRYAGSWSSRLKDCGFHTNHVHPKGWISSAYYIAVPDAAEDAREKQGWIKFGEPAFDTKFTDPVRRAVKPAPGTLVLFPSYMWHGTVPFRSPASRTTIAFDAVPKS
jgi:tetratricopeptide (TPR) repeat protein